MKTDTGSDPICSNFVAGPIVDADPKMLQRVEAPFEKPDGVLRSYAKD